jgi:hypothetical protein
MTAPWRERARAAVFCGVLSTTYWGTFSLVDEVGVSPVAQGVLYGACLSSWFWLRRAARPTEPLAWLSRGAQSVVLALLFYGGNAARDVLFGADRPMAATPPWLGGLALWWILCPGVMSVALAAAATAQLTARR